MNIELLSLFSFIIILLWVLVHAADLIEDAFVLIAKRIGISEFFIGFVILSAVSSLPEFSIALSSNNEIPELSVGNLLGATLILLTLIIGMTVVKFHGVSFTGRFKEREVVMGLAVILLGIGTLLDQRITIPEGVGLMLAYIAYALHIYSIYRHRTQDKDIAQLIPAKKTLYLLTRAVIGIVLILVASSLLVDTIIDIGNRVQINESLIGLFVLAIGTNIPELTILYRAKEVSQVKLAVGNFFGSATINMFTLGLLTLLAQGIDLTSENNETFLSLVPVLALLTLSVFYFFVFSFTNRKITRAEGYMLIGVYLSLLVTEGILLLNG